MLHNMNKVCKQQEIQCKVLKKKKIEVSEGCMIEIIKMMSEKQQERWELRL